MTLDLVQGQDRKDSLLTGFVEEMLDGGSSRLPTQGPRLVRRPVQSSLYVHIVGPKTGLESTNARRRLGKSLNSSPNMSNKEHAVARRQKRSLMVKRHSPE